MWRASRVVAIASIAAAVAAIANCGSLLLLAVNAPTYFGSFEHDADLRYGPDARQLLDVYRPNAQGPRPIVVFVHGGTWVKGDKSDFRFIGAALAEAGYVAVLPNYRLYPQVRFPEFVRDGARAVRWIREHATELGGDSEAMFLMGHSAGAHIVASLAMDPRYLMEVGGGPAWIRGWVGLSGPYALELRMPVLREIFQEPYTAVDWQPVSFKPGYAPGAPVLLIHGTDDMKVHPQEAVALQQKLTSAGVTVECRMYEYRTHMDTVSAFSWPLRGNAPVLDDVVAFIERTVAGAALNTPCPALNLRRDWSAGRPVTFNGQ